MAALTLVESGEVERYTLEGVLDFETVPAIMQSSVDIFANGKDVSVDLAGVTQVNSAALALLLEWQAMARSSSRHFHCQNIPSKLLKLAEVSRLDGMLTA